MFQPLQKAWKWSASHESTIQLLAFLGGLPAVATGLFLLWSGAVSTPARWTLSVLIVGVWLGCVLILRQRVVFPMQTLTNLLDALCEADYSVRLSRGHQSDSLGEVMATVNRLGETLLAGQQRATEATTLLRAVMAEIDVAVFTFDGKGCLRLINRAGAALLDRPESELLYRYAREIGLEECLEGDGTRTLARHFPGRSGTRWGLKRTGFREGGYPHQLLVLADLSRPLREEERAAWQRLIRVLGHELNNSLTPIQSIAQSLASMLGRPEALRSPDWHEHFEQGLSVLAGRAGAFFAADRTENLDRADCFA